MNTLIIKGELTDLNTYIQKERGNRYSGASTKRTNTDLVTLLCKSQKIKKIIGSVFITFRWYCKNKKKDKDNICFAKKFILDGLVNAHVLKSDGWDSIEGFEDEFVIDTKNPRI